MIRELTKDLDIISALENEPNDEGGLSATELKAKFDEGGNTIKTYINGTLIPDVSDTITSKVAAAELAAGNMPTGGSAGQMLLKRSDADYDLVYVDLPQSAETLTTPRAVQTDLSSELAAEFDGSEDITPGVTGVLPVEHGGTGADNVVRAAGKLGRGLCGCEAAAATAAKSVTLEDFALIPGAVIGVKFAYANTAENPTLNVNETGAATITDSVTGISVGKGKMGARTHFFQYDGESWILLNPTEWKYATGIFSMPAGGVPTNINLGFTPTAVVCQMWHNKDYLYMTSAFAALTPGVEQLAKNHPSAYYWCGVIATATGFTYTGYYSASGEMRYIAFL